MPNENDKGEGSYKGSADYQKGIDEFLDVEDAEELGRKALEEVDRNEPAYRKAEEEGKSRAAEEDRLLRK